VDRPGAVQISLLEINRSIEVQRGEAGVRASSSARLGSVGDLPLWTGNTLWFW